MLKTLSVNNLAVIRSLDVEFRDGMNVITGETGAGKSIVIDALGLILGDRANTIMIRDDQNTAAITAVFSIDDSRIRELVRSRMEALELDPSDELEIRREISRSGKSRAFINGAFINIGDLRSIGSLLVEMHGQHEHQLLLNADSHISYLDAFIRDEKIPELYRIRFTEFEEALKVRDRLLRDKEAYERDHELKTYHLREMEALDLQENELSSLEEENRILEHSQLLSELSHEIAGELYENEDSLTDRLKHVQKNLSRISGIDSSQAQNIAELESAVISLTELGRNMASYHDGIPHDPERHESVRGRLHSFYNLEKKHRRSYNELYEYYLSLKKELAEEDDFDTALASAEKKLTACRVSLGKAASSLHELRIRESAEFSGRINAILKNMGMKHASLKVEFRNLESRREPWYDEGGRRISLNVNGPDEVEFLITTNPGDSYKPLNLIASGGELSRIMLAIKVTLSESDATGTLIFDEADAGISGITARTVGEQILQLSRHHQVLCITHLPQIASLGDHHFLVEKHDDSGKSETGMRELTPEKRKNEIAKLISAGDITSHSLNAAEELLKNN